MTSHDDAVSRYFAAWNAETDDEVRRAVAAAFTRDASYTDPVVDIAGHEEITATIIGVHKQFPGFEFRLSGSPDAHHHIARFSWELVSGADGSAPVAGFDVIALADDGRIRAVSGFLDRLPAA
ncbi:nuclear transport factor 2 family protein [Frankia canadensis]|uniref:nuclear transport factor 2 family protein n=1 Tax=Frankia canadensis TaxID=1836972 RepID=UPI000C7B3E40|nr:nuclear transport factor 2 family protein [Frankia canadensis]